MLRDAHDPTGFGLRGWMYLGAVVLGTALSQVADLDGGPELSASLGPSGSPSLPDDEAQARALLTPHTPPRAPMRLGGAPATPAAATAPTAGTTLAYRAGGAMAPAVAPVLR